MTDINTLLSQFLTDLYGGTFGVTVPITRIKVGDGSAAAPALALSDGTTGWYGSAGIMRLSLAGVANVAVFTSGSSSISGSLTVGSLSAAGAVTAFNATAVPAGGAAGTGFTLSAVANLGVFIGSGVPTLSAAQGSIYLNTTGNSTATRVYVNTNGTTGWTNLTSAT